MAGKSQKTTLMMKIRVIIMLMITLIIMITTFIFQQASFLRSKKLLMSMEDLPLEGLRTVCSDSSQAVLHFDLKLDNDRTSFQGSFCWITYKDFGSLK